MRDTGILVRGRDALSSVPQPAAVVSMSDDPDDWPDLPAGCVAHLRLHFHDVEFDMHDGMFAREPRQLLAFTESQADEVAAFIEGRRGGPGIRSLVFQCEVGISRSAGMAAAVARHLGRDDMPYFRDYVPNRLVYRLTLEAMRRVDPI